MHSTPASRNLWRSIVLVGLAGLLSAVALAPSSAVADAPPHAPKGHKVRPVPPKPIELAIEPQHEPGDIDVEEQVKPEHRKKHVGDPISMKILVISPNGQEQYDFPPLTSELDRIGLPYYVLIPTQPTLNPAPSPPLPT